jgi:hypothetical protein
LRDDATEGIVYGAIADARCAGALLKVAIASRHLKGIRGTSLGFVRPIHAAQALVGGSLIESRERFRSQVGGRRRLHRTSGAGRLHGRLAPAHVKLRFQCSPLGEP